MVPPQLTQRPGRVGGLATAVERPHETQYRRNRCTTLARSTARCSADCSATSHACLACSERLRLVQRVHSLAVSRFGRPHVGHVAPASVGSTCTGPPSSIIASTAATSFTAAVSLVPGTVSVNILDGPPFVVLGQPVLEKRDPEKAGSVNTKSIETKC